MTYQCKPTESVLQGAKGAMVSCFKLDTQEKNRKKWEVVRQIKFLDSNQILIMIKLEEKCT